jgi:hypothetical protein
MRGDRVGSNIPAKIKWMELESRDEFPGQEVETGFCLAGQDILARGDQNQHWKIRKNKLSF